MKILINTPNLKSLGGVANHYLGLQKFWSYDFTHNYIGSRYNIPGSVLLPFDIAKFILKCIWLRPNMILLNPSLGKKALKRDSLYLKIANLLNFKTIVFIHGWSNSMEHYFDRYPKKFLYMYEKANGFLVLADEFRNKLQIWGIKSPIHLTTTKVDDELVSGFSLEHKQLDPNILFLARVEKEKGVFVVLNAFATLKKKYPKSRLTIAGDGSALTEAKASAKKMNLTDIYIPGRVSGLSLKKIFAENSIYVLPTSHGEGMPTSILEAMAFGQAIITAPKGGVKDFFQSNKMGYLIDSYNPHDYAEKISHLIENNDVLKRISKNNFEYAKDNFMASKVASQVEELIDKILL